MRLYAVSKVLPLLTLALALAWIAPTPARSQARAASIEGVIHFDGKAPTREAIDGSSDPVCAKTALLSSAVIVNKGKLQGVHVRIKSGTAGTHKTPSTPLVVTQVGCVYRPNVVGAMVGQAIAIKNEDKTMHNVHATIGKETWFNRSQPGGAPDIVETDTGAAGEVFELKCNVHPWMHSYIPITDHPFFDVSDKSGAFAIKNVPAGTYTLEAWHPKFGLKSTKVVVKGGATKASFHFP